MRVRVLLPGTVKFLGIIKLLAQKYGIEPVLYVNQIGPLLEAEGIKFEDLRPYFRPPAGEDAYLRALLQEREALFEGCPAPPLSDEREGGVRAFALGALYRGTLAQVQEEILIIEALHRLQEANPISLLVVHEDVTRPTKTMVLAARDLGIPTLHVSHGIPALRNIHDRIYADVTAVYGRRTAEWYVRNGNPPEKIVVTGSPFWDEYFQELPPRDLLCRRLNLDPRLPVITYASTWVNALSAINDSSAVEVNFAAVLEAVKALRCRQEVQLVVKLHPTEPSLGRTEHWYLRLGLERGVRVDTALRSSLREVLAVSDTVICLDSNSGVEAMLLQKPVISLRAGKVAGLLFWQGDPVLVAHDAAELLSSLNWALFDPEARAWLKERRKERLLDFNAGLDGRATERVAELAAGLAREGRLTEELRQRVEAPENKAALAEREEGDSFDLSVVIAGRNGLSSLEEGLACLVENLEATGSYEVIYVDEASDDETPLFLQRLEGDVRVLLHRVPQGRALSFWEGAAFARGRRIAFLPLDDLVSAWEELSVALTGQGGPCWILGHEKMPKGLVLERKLWESCARWVKAHLSGATLGDLIAAFQKVR